MKRFASSALKALLISFALIPAWAQATTEMYFIHTDHLGTPQVMTDDTGSEVWRASYRPFGELAEVEGSADLSLRFPGQYEDPETGYYYNYFRDYDPSLGRYVQSDPVGLNGGVNTYAYVGGNPVSYVDPLGLVRIGNCDINVFTGKTVCSETVGNERNSCTFSSNGNISCEGRRGPLLCKAEYDAEKDEVDFDYEVTAPGVNWVKSKYEAVSIALEVGADRIEAGAEKFIDRYNNKRENSIGR